MVVAEEVRLETEEGIPGEKTSLIQILFRVGQVNEDPELTTNLDSNKWPRNIPVG